MKKAFIIILVLTSTFAFSQSKTLMGIKAGANYSTITNANFDAKMGVYAGLFLNIQFSDFYALQPEVVYSNQGGTSKLLGDEDVDIHYIALSVVNKFFVMNDHRFHFLAGVGLDLDLDDNIVSFANNGFDDNIFFMDMTVFGGLGYQFDMGLIIEARYKRGLIGVFIDEFFEYDSDHYNSLFQFGMAYKFDLKKAKK